MDAPLGPMMEPRVEMGASTTKVTTLESLAVRSFLASAIALTLVLLRTKVVRPVDF